ncbi:MAG: SIMPL domain-containing protein [Hungatella sp.]
MKRKNLFFAIAIAAALGLTACAGAPIPDTIQVKNAANQVIHVESKEEIKVVPDIAEIVLGVYSQDPDAKICQSHNETALKQALEVLTTFGVAETSIQTSGYGLNPVYNWEAEKTITGYEMTTTITVSDLPLDRVGSLLTSCVDAGVNNIQSVSYLSSQYEESYAAALTKAIESARIKAQAIADAGGCTLGEISHVEEFANAESARYDALRNASDNAMTAQGEMSVMPGQVGIEARVAVDFSILPK